MKPTRESIDTRDGEGVTNSNENGTKPSLMALPDCPSDMASSQLVQEQLGVGVTNKEGFVILGYVPRENRGNVSAPEVCLPRQNEEELAQDEPQKKKPKVQILTNIHSHFNIFHADFFVFAKYSVI